MKSCLVLLLLFFVLGLNANPSYQFNKFLENGKVNYSVSIADTDRNIKRTIPICDCESAEDLKSLFDLPKNLSLKIDYDDDYDILKHGCRLEFHFSCSSTKQNNFKMKVYADYRNAQYVLNTDEMLLIVPLQCNVLISKMELKKKSERLDSHIVKIMDKGILIACGDDLIPLITNNKQKKEKTSNWTVYLYSPMFGSPFYLAVNEYLDKKSLFPVFKINGITVAQIEERGLIQKTDEYIKKIFNVTNIDTIHNVEDFTDESIGDLLPHSIFWDINSGTDVKRRTSPQPFILKEKDKELNLDLENQINLTDLSIYNVINLNENGLDYAVVNKDETMILFDRSFEDFLRYLDIPIKNSIDLKKVAKHLEDDIHVKKEITKFHSVTERMTICRKKIMKGDVIGSDTFKKGNECKKSDHILKIELVDEVIIRRPIIVSSEAGFDEIIVEGVKERSSSDKARIRVAIDSIRMGENEIAIKIKDIKKFKLTNIEMISSCDYLADMTYVGVDNSYFEGDKLLFEKNSGKTFIKNDIFVKEKSIVSISDSHLKSKMATIHLNDSLGLIQNCILNSEERYSLFAHSSSVFSTEGTICSKDGVMLQKNSTGTYLNCSLQGLEDYLDQSSAFILNESSSVNIYNCDTNGFVYGCNFKTSDCCFSSSFSQRNNVKTPYKGNGKYLINNKIVK